MSTTSTRTNTHNTAGQPYLKLQDLKVGMMMHVDGGFSCMPEGDCMVEATQDGELFVPCSSGSHLLEGQCEEDGTMVGITAVVNPASPEIASAAA